MTKYLIIGVAAFAILSGLVFKIYSMGVQAERTASLTKAVKLVKERDSLNVQTKNATPADVCRRLGGTWLPDTNECG